MNAIADELAHEPEQELLISRTPEKVWRIRPGGGRAFGAKESTKLRISLANRNPD
jgi:hypothetical protein